MESEVKKNELRLKNLLKRGEDIVIVSAIFISHFNCVNEESGIDYGNNHQNNFQPIPLTEEWLLKFGFVKIGTNYENKWLVLWGNIKTKSIDFVLNEPHSRKRKITELKHVHQLQNFYFALTGEELTIKQK